MRNTNKTILALMAGAMVLGACSKEAVVEEPIADETLPVKGNVCFTATVSDDEGCTTRTALDSLDVVWSTGDEISVFSNGINNKCTLSSGAGSTNGSFVGSCETGTEVYAIYPYSENNKLTAYDPSKCSDFIIDWNGINQTAVAGSFPLSTPMVAYTENVEDGATTIPLSFQNVCAFVKFTTDYACKSIVLKATGEYEYLASDKLYVDYDDNKKPHIYQTGGNKSNTVTLTGKDGANLQAGTYYIAVMPGTLGSGFELTFTNIYGEKTWTKSTTNKATFKRGTILNLGGISIKGEMIKMAGTGKSSDPYTIHDFDQLVGMREFVNTSTGGADCYKLVGDIDGDGKKFMPIGTCSKPFFGQFDGGNHYIKNLCIEGTVDYQISSNNPRKACALFGAIKDATICNLTIENPSLSYGENNSIGFCTVSPLVGISFGADNTFENSRCKFLNCKIKGDYSISFANSSTVNAITYGGFVAVCQSNLEITNCSTEINLMINDPKDRQDVYVGGFLGEVYGVNETNSTSLERDGYVRINRCRNNSKTMSFEEGGYISVLHVGGFIGKAIDGAADDDVACRIYNSVNNASIQVKKKVNKGIVYLGGFIGCNNSDGYSDIDPTIENCINNGDLTISTSSSEYFLKEVGGICGYNYDDDTKLTNCVNTGTLSCGLGILRPSAISYTNGTFTQCWDCTGNYSICEEGAGDMTNCGQKSMDEIVDHMNSTPSVTSDPNNYFHRWKKSTFNGREVLDLDF